MREQLTFTSEDFLLGFPGIQGSLTIILEVRDVSFKALPMALGVLASRLCLSFPFVTQYRATFKCLR